MTLAESDTEWPLDGADVPYSGVAMTHTTLTKIRFLSLPAVIVFALPLHADDSIQVRLNEVCKVADGNRLTISTSTGERVEGYCMSINVDEIAVTTRDQRVVKIARKALSRIDMQRSKNDGHQLRLLGRGLRQGFGLLLSPMAPLGLAIVPPMLAWGAVAAPFCIIGDLTHQANRTQEIKVI